MTVRFSDGFDNYSTSADYTKRWGSVGTATPTFSSSTGRYSGGTITIASASGTAGVSNLSTKAGTLAVASTHTFCMGCWFKCATPPTAAFTAGNFINFQSSAAATIGGLGITATSGTCVFQSNVGAAVLTGATNVCDNNWHWIEFKCTVGTTQSQQIYVDGLLDATGTGTVVLATATVDRIVFFNLRNSVANASDFKIDDVIIYDETAGGLLSTTSFPIGPIRITTINPTSDSAVQFARSTGASNFSCINETVGDATAFVSSSTSTNKDLYGYSSLGFLPNSIITTVLNSYVENPGGGTINFKGICKSNLTETDGTSTLTPAAAATLQQEFLTDPNTAAAWTASGLNASKFGILVV